VTKAARNPFIVIFARIAFAVIVTNSAESVVPFADMCLVRNVNLHICVKIAIHFIVTEAEKESFAACARE
jgi:hypothetical protein